MTTATDPALLEWLLDSDPALRWQVERDVAGAPPEVWRATRDRTATEGFGARLLALQDPDGQWAGGAYFPAEPSPDDAADAADADRADADDAEAVEEPRDEWPSQPYTATTWSLNSLREWGVDAGALAGTAQKLAENSRWEYEDLPYWGGEVDACINGFTLANGGWLGADVSGVVRWFAEHRMADGGWNCDWIEGSTRSSFHSTLNAIEGILSYEIATGDDGLREARHAGEEYLLERRLLNRLSTGERVGHFVGHQTYPFRWVYSALHALDHFRAAALHDGVPPDPRLADAVALVRSRRQPDGTWTQDRPWGGAVWFATDVPEGEPSKWLTLVAARALAWWDDAHPESPEPARESA